MQVTTVNGRMSPDILAQNMVMGGRSIAACVTAALTLSLPCLYARQGAGEEVGCSPSYRATWTLRGL